MDQQQPNNNNEAQILEQGDIYFFYRPKKGAEEVKGIEDVRRFFMVIAPEESQLYRLFVIGKKSLPEIRETEARASERYWVRVGGIFKDASELQRSFHPMNSEEEMLQDQLEKESMRL